MIDKEAIQELAQSQAISAANADIPARYIVALPDNFALHDVEQHMEWRRRLRGTMTTSSVPDFAAYALAHQEPGASTFINADNMAAVAVLNLGSPQEPGHADNAAKLQPKRTAAYAALMAHANGMPLKQAQVAEFIEDWRDAIVCMHGDETIPTSQAIAAVRSITIEALRKQENVEQQLSATRSAFESVQASSIHKIPTLLQFVCMPYVGFASRKFDVRISIQTGDKPALVLRIVKQEWHAEDMANELAALVRNALQGAMPVMVGTYTPSK